MQKSSKFWQLHHDGVQDPFLIVVTHEARGNFVTNSSHKFRYPKRIFIFFYFLILKKKHQSASVIERPSVDTAELNDVEGR